MVVTSCPCPCPLKRPLCNLSVCVDILFDVCRSAFAGSSGSMTPSHLSTRCMESTRPRRLWFLPPSLGQRSCLDNVAATIFHVGDPPLEVTAAGSFNEICGASAGYGEHGVSARVPFDPRLLALPSLGSVPGDPSRFLSGSDLEQWEHLAREHPCFSSSGS